MYFTSLGHVCAIQARIRTWPLGGVEDEAKSMQGRRVWNLAHSKQEMKEKWKKSPPPSLSWSAAGMAGNGGSMCFLWFKNGIAKEEKEQKVVTPSGGTDFTINWWPEEIARIPRGCRAKKDERRRRRRRKRTWMRGRGIGRRNRRNERRRGKERLDTVCESFSKLFVKESIY